MKRLLAASLVLLALTACGDTQRPEGIVERWLQSLDQGRAGTPEKYATGDVSERILPGFRTLDPGRFDVIEVGKAHVPSGSVEFPQYAVPFRVVDLDGNEVRGVALAAPTGDGSWVVALDPGDHPLPLPSEGGPRIAEVSSADWIAGTVVAAALVVIAVGLMWLVRRSVKTVSR